MPDRVLPLPCDGMATAAANRMESGSGGKKAVKCGFYGTFFKKSF
jgi:hypothetical protein